MNRQVYIGNIKNDKYDVKPIVIAENPEEAVRKVLDKFKDGLGTSFQEENVTVHPFADR